MIPGLETVGKVVEIAGGIKGLFGGKGNSDAIEAQERAAYQNYLWQKEFAQSGVKWRVDDAVSAGVHPVYVLGGSGASFSPSTSVFDGSSSQHDVAGSMQSLGQSLQRAGTATETGAERHVARMRMLAEDRAELENVLLRSQIAREGAQIGPPMPSVHVPSAMPGQESALGRVGIIEEPLPPYAVKRSEIPSVQPGHPTQQAGAWPGVRWERTQTGWKPHHSKELIEDSDLTNIPYVEWFWNNRVLPSVGVGHNPPPDSFLPKGATGWLWDPFKQEYRPSFARGGRSSVGEWLERAGPNWIRRRGP